MNIMKLALVLALAVMSVIPVNATPFLPNESEGKVYYFAFEIERATGIPEHQMEEYGCEYKINIQKFISLLHQDDSLSTKYNRLDVRAKVVLKNVEPYFVSRQGLVRHRNEYFVLNKQDFDSNLTKLRTRGCHQLKDQPRNNRE